MDILNFILGLKQQRQQQQQMGYLDEIMGKAIAGQQGMPGVNIPSDMPTDIYSPFYNPTTGGMEGRPEVPKGTLEETMQDFKSGALTDPRLLFQTKMAVPEMVKGYLPEKEKQHWQAVQGEENIWLLNSNTGELKETKTHIKGKPHWNDPEKDEEGNLIQKNLKTGEVKIISKFAEAGAPKTRELKHKTEIITQEFDPKTQTWKEISRAPREIEKPGDLATGKKKQIDIWKEGINSRLGKYSPLGSGIVVSLAEGFDLGEARNAYTMMKKEADKGNLTARRDLQAVDHWIDQIGKTVGEPEKPSNDPLGLRKR